MIARVGSILVLLTATGLAAQGVPPGTPIVRGDVVLADSITRAAGVIVVIVDATAGAVSPAVTPRAPSGALNNATVASTLTNSAGLFSLQLPAPGRYAARVLRVGYRPTVVAPFDVRASAPTVLHIVLGAEAVHLAEVKVRGEDVCRVRSDSGKLVAQVWEQARQALASTRLSAFDGGLHVSALLYNRTLDSTARTVLRATSSTEQGFTAHAFASVSGDSLNTAGYARRVDESVEYLGPDADALISDAFASSHCFRIMPPTPAWPRSVGVAFRPARERRGIVDIAGTFWLDRETAELQALEYMFTNLSREMAEPGAGGRIEFARLESGSWLVNRWRIRVETAAIRREAEPSRSELMRTPNQIRVFDRFVNAFGGEVTSARSGEREVYANSSAVYDAVVVKGAGSPLTPDSVQIELEGPGYFATGDSAGRLHLSRLRPGTYQAIISTSTMRATLLPAVPRTVVVRDTRVAGAGAVDTLSLPTGDEMVSAICGPRAVERREALVVGTLRDSLGQPLGGDSVRVLTRNGAQSAMDFAKNGYQGSYTAVADQRGRWYACGLPRNISIAARAVGMPARVDMSVVRLPPALALIVIDVVGTRRP